MPNQKEKSCLSDLGGLLQLFGGVLVLGGQVAIYFAFMPFLTLIPTYPPEVQPLLELIAQMMVIIIVVMVLSGIAIIISGVISFFRSGTLGGFLALFFGIAVIAAGAWMMYVIYFYPGIAHFAGAALAIAGSILSIIPAVKGPPKPKTRREQDIIERKKQKR
jgi:hypothetical protein